MSKNVVYLHRFYEGVQMGTDVPYFYTKNMSIKEKAKKLLEEALEERPDIFLIDFTISENNDIKLVIDSDTGATVDDIVIISRKIEHNLDREVEDFSLTVSSVDITQPFALLRQFKKNIDRKIKVKTETGEKEGKLVAVEANEILIEYKVREPKPVGKGKVTVIKQDKIAFDDIKEAKVVLKF